MKKRSYLSIFLGTGLSMAGFAQVKTLPPKVGPAKVTPVNAQPVLSNPPTAHIPKPADLVITQAILSRITRNDNAGAYDIAVSFTVRNNGETASNGITKLKAFYATSSPGAYKAPTPYPLGANDPGARLPPWTPCAAEPSIGRVEPGATWSQTVSFQALYQDFSPRGEKFYLLALADFYNNTPESDEHNNYSVPIFITPPH